MMLEPLLLRALEEATGCPAYMEQPEDKPERYFVLERTGGGERGAEMRTATVAVQSYGPTMLDATALNEQVLDIARELQYKETSIISCEVNSTYNFTDTRTKRYRFQTVIDLVYFA